MKISDLLTDYLDGKTDAINTIRVLSGIFDPKNATDLLVLINGITRLEKGDMDKDNFRSIWML